MISAVTNHLWQSTVFAVMAGLLSLAFRRNRAHVRYWLWFGATLKFLLPFSLLINFGSRLDLAPDAAKVVPAEVATAIVHVGSPTHVLERGSLESPIELRRNPKTVDWLSITLVAVWFAGFSAIVFIRMKAWLRIRAVVRQATPCAITNPVQILYSQQWQEPGVVGLWRPVLLLPADIPDRLTPMQLEAVLAHEYSHVRRRDNLTSAIHMIVEAIFWFHPLVWWIGARLLDERERSCDESVLQHGNDPRDYAEGILNVCKAYIESPLRCVSGITGSDLKKRIHVILTGQIARELGVSKTVVLIAAAAVSVSIPVFVGIAQSIPQETFEVASIKIGAATAIPQGMRGGSGAPCGGMLQVQANRFTAANTNIYKLIASAYDKGDCEAAVKHGLISGGPSWVKSDAFQIQALIPEGSDVIQWRRPLMGTPARLQGMLRSLLTDRFKLKLHTETKEIQVYELTVAKGGSKLKPFEEGSCNASFPPTTDDYCKHLLTIRESNWVLTEDGITVDQFARIIGQPLDHPVVNRTGLNGPFSFRMQFAVDGATAGDIPPEVLSAQGIKPSDPSGTSIFTAMQEQLGLSLRLTRLPVEALVIDHVEKPSAN